jgi:hypothetical protein
MNPESYYPQSASAQLNAVYNREARSPRTTNPNPQQLPSMGRGSVPKFTKCNNVAELNPKVNLQPPFRRANPEGGFISVSKPNMLDLAGFLTLCMTTAFTSVDNPSALNVQDM